MTGSTAPTRPVVKGPTHGPGAGVASGFTRPLPVRPMRPAAASFVLCDAIRRDALNKLSLLGLFDVLNADRFPAEFRDS
jgi:hypothetical protein